MIKIKMFDKPSGQWEELEDEVNAFLSRDGVEYISSSVQTVTNPLGVLLTITNVVYKED